MERLRGRYGDVGLEQAEVVVALGGDGLMLQTLRDAMEKHIPVFGMNCGSVGFLMNDYADDGLFERLAAAKPTRIAPLAMHVRDTDGGEHDALALNEVSLFRMTYQAMKVEIVVDGRTQMDELICDGILLSTPAGSTASTPATGTTRPTTRRSGKRPRSGSMAGSRARTSPRQTSPRTYRRYPTAARPSRSRSRAGSSTARRVRRARSSRPTSNTRSNAASCQRWGTGTRTRTTATSTA